MFVNIYVCLSARFYIYIYNPGSSACLSFKVFSSIFSHRFPLFYKYIYIFWRILRWMKILWICRICKGIKSVFIGTWEINISNMIWLGELPHPPPPLEPTDCIIIYTFFTGEAASIIHSVLYKGNLLHFDIFCIYLLIILFLPQMSYFLLKQFFVTFELENDILWRNSLRLF